ncbi:MAG: TadE/TadG family type IV pilus assembly protein [Alphaproteobacteria bacterium]
MQRRKTRILPRPLKLNVFRSDTGATAVEFAIIAPIFLSFLFGILELGRLILTQGMLTYAVQEGSRYASANVTGTAAQIQSVFTDSFVGIDAAPASVAVTPAAMPDGTTQVMLAATYRFQTLVPLLSSGPIILNASSSGWR